MAIYHCIGDSHTWQFIGKLPENLNNNNIENYKKKYNRIYENNNKKNIFYGYRCCEDGAYAYNINKRIPIIREIIDKINKEDIIIFMFGEVDCRYKIYSQSIKNKTNIEEEVKKVVNKYCETIKNNFNLNKIILWGPHPPHTQPEHPYIDVKDSNIINYITKLYNENLQIKCIEYNWNYISLYNELNNENINTYFLNDTIHLDPFKIINIYLKKLEKIK